MHKNWVIKLRGKIILCLKNLCDQITCNTSEPNIYKTKKSKI